MSSVEKKRSWRWLRRAAWVLAGKLTLIAAAIAFLLWSGAADLFLKRMIMRRLEAMTHGRVELREFSMRWWGLRARLKGLVIHGTEPDGTEPLFSIEELEAGIRVDSVWGRKGSLDEAVLRGPHVHLRVEKDGASNLPPLPSQKDASKPIFQQLIDLRIRKIEVTDGWILYNDVRTPLALEGGALHFELAAGGAAQPPLHVGSLDWKEVSFTAKGFLLAPANLSLQFSLGHGAFTVEHAVIECASSRLDAQAEMTGFTNPDWKFRYRGWLRLEDLRQILREPLTPSGRVEFRGDGTYSGGQVRITGDYAAREIKLDYPEFRASDLSSRAGYVVDNHGITIPEFRGQAFGGTIAGRVSYRFDGQSFRAETRVRGASLAGVLAALDRRGFPVGALHWDAVLSANTVETWTADFKHFEVSGETSWSSAGVGGRLPSDGDFNFLYRHDARKARIFSGRVATPSSLVTASGTLSADDSALDIHFETGDLSAWNDFVHAIQRSSPHGTVVAQDLAGSARWDGRILGPLAGPTFVGHARGERVRYGTLAWDLLETDMSYSPDEFSVSRGRLRHGAFDAEVEADLHLTDWRFLPGNEWTADVNLLQSSVDSLQNLAGSNYPLTGSLTGQFHGRGTRAAPSVTGLIDLSDGRAGGVSFNRLRGQLTWNPDEARIANAELRLFAREKDAAQNPGIVTGTFGYRFADETISADLAGAGLWLEGFEKLQSPRLPVGGRLSFNLRAQGPRSAPQAEGSFRIVDLRVGQEVIGSFEGKLTADGQEARLEIDSAMTNGKLKGSLRAGLHGDFSLTGKFSVSGMDLDPFLVTALHLQQVSGHGLVDGEFELSGSLARPQSIAVAGSLSRFVLNYENVRLENAGPVVFRYSGDELRISQGTFRGPDTNLEISGLVQFAGQRRASLTLNGALNLRLLSGYFPDLDARGAAQVHATVEGTLDRPRVNGRVRIENASARVQDFPTGLTGITGDFVFDATRLFFENVTAEAGGGKLDLSGSVSYAEQPLRYDITARTAGVRIRYPEGMSWLAGGSLRLTGTPQAGLLSGRVAIDHVTMAEGLQVAGALVAAKEGISGPATSSPFLRNLQFDIEAVSAPDARMEWPGAELEAEANIRARGTWEHPILLGHIHILSGDLAFAGNRYRVTRGDLNFSNPFRLDPVLNVEATTNIQHHEITLNFNGPASKLTLAYRSDPPLPANDIITLLALGKTSSEGGSRSGGLKQGGGAGASELLSEAISSQLGGRLERLFGITRLRVDPGLSGIGSTGSSQSAARVSVEQRIVRNLTITYVTNVASTQQQIIQVEYNMNRNISIVALRDQNGTFGLDIRIKKRFP